MEIQKANTPERIFNAHAIERFAAATEDCNGKFSAFFRALVVVVFSLTTQQKPHASEEPGNPSAARSCETTVITPEVNSGARQRREWQ